MESDTFYIPPAGWNTSIVGFKLTMSRHSSKYIFLYYLPTGRIGEATCSQRVILPNKALFPSHSGMFVAISSTSFLIPPTAYPARFGMLLTTLLVQLTIILYPHVPFDPYSFMVVTWFKSDLSLLKLYIQ